MVEIENGVDISCYHRLEFRWENCFQKHYVNIWLQTLGMSNLLKLYKVSKKSFEDVHYDQKS